MTKLLLFLLLMINGLIIFLNNILIFSNLFAIVFF